MFFEIFWDIFFSFFSFLTEKIVIFFSFFWLLLSGQPEIATKHKSNPREKLPIQVQGRPLMLGDEIDQKVQLYIKQVGRHGGVISRTIAVKVLLARDESFGNIKITETWTMSLLKRMG